MNSHKTFHYLFKNASISATMSAVGAVSGLILDALILSVFGVGYQTDAFFTSLTVPTLLNGLFSIQSPKILVPLFSGYFSRDDHAGAWDLLNNLVTCCFLALAGVCLAAMALARVVV